jgi:hypothetical protein
MGRSDAVAQRRDECLAELDEHSSFCADCGSVAQQSLIRSVIVMVLVAFFCVMSDRMSEQATPDDVVDSQVRIAFCTVAISHICLPLSDKKLLNCRAAIAKRCNEL